MNLASILPPAFVAVSGARFMSTLDDTRDDERGPLAGISA